MHSTDVVGYIASALVLITIYMKDMVALRVAAICSNVAFLVYGGSLHLAPVIFLHSLLLPLNVWCLTSAEKWQRLLEVVERAHLCETSILFSARRRHSGLSHRRP